jgi:para-aminobenzoate synthetase component I
LSAVLQSTLAPRAVCARLRAGHPVSLFLDGTDSADGWRAGSLVAVAPRVIASLPASATPATVRVALDEIGRLWRERAARGAGPSTGLALVLGYEALDAARAGERDPLAMPRMTAIEVDRSLRWFGPERIVRSGLTESEAAEIVRAEPRASSSPGARALAPLETSLPHADYQAAFARLARHIVDGDLYQANLCRVWHGSYRGDELVAYEDLTRRTPAPRSAFVETPDFTLASASPEVFLALDPAGEIETWPIKGTRPRGSTPETDRAAREELLRSEKDRAELLMIVDLERNDLGRVCGTGSIEAAPFELRSFAAVHHLVARVRGRLRPDAALVDLVEATFPGGSISGAPKERARSILGALEPIARGFFTGSLFWLGDDGSLDSSILIRTLVFREGRFHLGAGSGIVFDSNVEDEWDEGSHKARPLAQVLGFDPADVG